MTVVATGGRGEWYPSAARFDSTIQRFFVAAAAAGPGHPYVVDGDIRLSLAEVSGRAAAMQHRLQCAGVGVGDVVTVQLPNWWQTIATMYAAWGLGAIVNPVTPIYRAAELRAILGSSRPKAMVAPDIYRGLAYPPMVAGALAEIGHHAEIVEIRRDDDERPVLDSAAVQPFQVEPGMPDDIAMLMYTSGTTGRPKGVLHSHRTLLYESYSIASTFGLDGDPIFMPSPLTHITGLLYGVLMPVQIDATVVLLGQWDADEARAVIEREGCTMTVSATPFLRGLTDSYQQVGKPSALRTFVCGGADIPAALVGRAEAVMGTSVSRTYGSTEMPTLCIVRPGDDPERRLTTEGRVIGEAQARLAACDTGVGELEARGPELFVGYVDPADNDAAFTPDGWFRTGDLATITDAGEVAIVGRLKDVIVRGGENISAKEVEDLLATHPAIRDVAVVAIPDDLMGERACAVIVTDGTPLTLAQLAAHLDAGGIARQKYPEALHLVTELPRTVSGKVQKFQLRSQAAAALMAGEVETRR